MVFTRVGDGGREAVAAAARVVSSDRVQASDRV